MTEITNIEKEGGEGILAVLVFYGIFLIGMVVLMYQPYPIRHETLDRESDGCRVEITRFSNNTVKTVIMTCPEDGQ